MGSPELTVAERLRSQISTLTPAERRVARTLLANYPVRGLEPAAKLAAASGVSAPTVLRLITKLSFASYTDFQQSLKTEVSVRMSSPLEMHADRARQRQAGALASTEELLCEGIHASFARLPPAEFEQAVRLLSDPRRGVMLIGGRFSSMLAEYLAAHLRILRPGVRLVSGAGTDRTSSVLDVRRRDVLVAFDYRRYQRDTTRLAGAAKDQGAIVIAFTDPYLSPLSAFADVILTSSVASASPFDAATPALALVEALIAALVDRMGDALRERMSRYDVLHAGAVDGADGGPAIWPEARQ